MARTYNDGYGDDYVNPDPKQPRYFTEPLKFWDGEGDPKRYLGVEMEVAGVTKSFKAIDEVLAKWQASAVTDGSIRPPVGAGRGFEIRTSPARGHYFEEQINDLCKVLNENDAQMNASCGLHCHIDVRDFTPNGLYKAAIIWTKIEKEMFAKVAQSRSQGGYCYLWQNRLLANVQKKDGLIKAFYSIYNTGIQGGHAAALSFSAINAHGTLENRLHEGTLDAKEIIAWGKLNAQIFEFCHHARIGEAKEVKSLKDILEYKPKATTDAKHETTAPNNV